MCAGVIVVASVGRGNLGLGSGVVVLYINMLCGKTFAS